MSLSALGARQPHGPVARARLVAGLLGLLIAVAGIPAWTSSPSAAASDAGDGSDWNSTGITHSSSAETVTWGNDGNRPTSVVPRDGTQALPHTGGQTYDEIRRDVVRAYFGAFGPGNGLGGMKVRVSQTQDLVNQAVNLDISGVAGGAPPGLPSSVYLQVFQCWGGLNANGSPNPNAANPDPATCQVGAGDAAANRAGAFANANSRYINTDPLVPMGDWARYFNKGGKDDVPFTAITGQRSGSTNGADNQFFSAATTNEISKIQVSANGTAVRQFEVQTSVESEGLGCGRRSGQASTGSCWLVIVPRIDGVLPENGPISPSLWAQRLQVKLGFRDIVAGCPSGQDRTLTVGSELLSTAAASWTPGLCDAENIALGYTQLGDPVARNEFDNGATPAALTTQPVDGGAVYVPVSLTAPVFAYALSYQPICAARPQGYTEAEAKSCGYSGLDELNADIARSGQLVRNLRLDARLVAKLLTQSYAFSIIDQEGFRRSGWMLHRPVSLGADPEFKRLNPGLVHLSPTASAINELDHLILAALRSDAAAQVWRWLLQDPDARAFLNGCPDADGMVINPFYSTRTHQGCENQRDSLEAAADQDRKDTPTPDSYADLALSYPPDGSPYPLPGWQEARVAGTPPFTVFDLLPRVDSMPVAGRDVAIGYVPGNSNLCLTVNDPSCVPSPGKWTDPKTRQTGDLLGAMAITTAATAARFQLPTAQLCDSKGSHCVGADNGSLAKAAARFTASPVDGVVGPGTPDYAAGAYPLTMPVYAAVSTKLDASDQHAYGRALAYITGAGQVPGYSPGDLPPGYAPLTSALRARAKTAITTLLAATDAEPAGHGSKGSHTGSGSIPGSTNPGSTGGSGGNVPAAGAPVGAPAVGSVVDPSTQFTTVSAGTDAFPRWILPFGLGITLLTGLAGPLLRLRSTVKIG